MVEFDTLLNSDAEDFSLIDPKVTEACEHIADVGLRAGFESWGTFISRGILYNCEGSRYGSTGDFAGQESEPLVVTTIDWSGDRKGLVHVLLPADGAKGVIAYFLAVAMGTDPDPEGTPLDDESMDAYSELANTLAAQFAQALRGDPEVGGNINTNVKHTIRVADTAEGFRESFGDGDILCHTGTLTIEGIQPVRIRMLMDVACTGLSAEIEERKITVKEEVPTLGKPTFENETLARKLPIPVLVLLAKRRMQMKEVQGLAPGSIIEFRKQSGEFLDICAKNTKFGAGEVVIVNQHFGIQIRTFSPTIPTTEELIAY